MIYFYILYEYHIFLFSTHFTFFIKIDKKDNRIIKEIIQQVFFQVDFFFSKILNLIMDHHYHFLTNC